MQSEIVARGCAPTDTHPLVETVAQASNAELTDIYRFWQAQPVTLSVRVLAIGIVEREILDRISLDASQALTAAQQSRVITFARGASQRIAAFERFYVVKGAQSGAVWIVYEERQFGRLQAHALLVEEDGAIGGEVDPSPADRLGSKRQVVNILPLLAADGSDTPLLASLKPPLAIEAETS